MTMSPLAELEQVELESRAMRLAAQAEADRRLAAARVRAEEIAATGDREVAAALADLRERCRETADAEIATVHAELARFERQAIEGHETELAFQAAMAAIVAAVLGEREA